MSQYDFSAVRHSQSKQTHSSFSFRHLPARKELKKIMSQCFMELQPTNRNHLMGVLENHKI